MVDQFEEVEALAVNELLPEAQSTSSPSSLNKKDGQRKRKGIFRSEWLQEYNFLKEYKPDQSQVTCMACNSQFNIHYGGKNDVLQHSKSKQHTKNMLTFNTNRQLITTTMKPIRENDQIAAAEAAIVYHSVRHGISYLAQQCTTNVLKTLFASSSSIAKSLSCGRTKAAAIATDILAPYFTQIVLEEIKLAFHYSLSFDASNKGNLKTYPFCIQYFSDIGVKKGDESNFFKTMHQFMIFLVILDFIEDSNESAVDVHRNAREILNKYDLKIDGLTSIGADNTNVNMGDHHSVFSLFRDEKENVLKGNST